MTDQQTDDQQERPRRDEPEISPVHPDTMPRAEDDDETFANSPEFHDRQAPTRPGTPAK